MTTTMTKTEFNKRVVALAEASRSNTGAMESVAMWCGTRIPDVLQYAAICEKSMELNLANVGKKRKTTFTSDISIAEWCGGKNGVIETVQRSANEWKNDVEYISELVLSVNWKAREHDARGNRQWVIFYSALYDSLRDLMCDYYEGDDEKTSYMYEYLD